MGRRIGLVNDQQWERFTGKRQQIEAEMKRLSMLRDGSGTYLEILRRPDVSYDSLPVKDDALPADVRQEVEIQVKYQGYIARDLEQIDRFRRLEDKKLPRDIDYEKIPALRFESRQKLKRFRPDTVGQASRISGVTPADIAILLVWLKKIGSRT
jgi:tRNA uridine 5-carboxymethylaminomethyl modification enzyme